MQVHCERRYASREYSSFSDVLRDFLGATSALGMKPPLSACFAVAGPDYGAGHQADQFAVADECDGAGARIFHPRVKLINDFEAVALSVEVLAADDLVVAAEGHALC